MIMNLYSRSTRSVRFLVTIAIHRQVYLLVNLLQHLMPCKCSHHIDSEGIGKCLKRDGSFSGQFSCLVWSPSSCIDAKDVPEYDYLQKSAIACEDKNERKNNGTFISSQTFCQS